MCILVLLGSDVSEENVVFTFFSRLLVCILTEIRNWDRPHWSLQEVNKILLLG